MTVTSQNWIHDEISSSGSDYSIVNELVYRRKWSWPNLRHYPGIVWTEYKHGFFLVFELFIILSPRSGHVGFVVDKVALGRVFSQYFGFPYQFSFH
jgi:hypothetical protein